MMILLILIIQINVFNSCHGCSTCLVCDGDMSNFKIKELDRRVKETNCFTTNKYEECSNYRCYNRIIFEVEGKEMAKQYNIMEIPIKFVNMGRSCASGIQNSKSNSYNYGIQKFIVFYTCGFGDGNDCNRELSLKYAIENDAHNIVKMCRSCKEVFTSETNNMESFPASSNCSKLDSNIKGLPKSPHVTCNTRCFVYVLYNPNMVTIHRGCSNGKVERLMNRISNLMKQKEMGKYRPKLCKSIISQMCNNIVVSLVNRFESYILVGSVEKTCFVCQNDFKKESDQDDCDIGQINNNLQLTKCSSKCVYESTIRIKNGTNEIKTTRQCSDTSSTNLEKNECNSCIDFAIMDGFSPRKNENPIKTYTNTRYNSMHCKILCTNEASCRSIVIDNDGNCLLYTSTSGDITKDKSIEFYVLKQITECLSKCTTICDSINGPCNGGDRTFQINQWIFPNQIKNDQFKQTQSKQNESKNSTNRMSSTTTSISTTSEFMEYTDSYDEVTSKKGKYKQKLEEDDDQNSSEESSFSDYNTVFLVLIIIVLVGFAVYNIKKKNQPKGLVNNISAYKSNISQGYLNSYS